MSETKVSIEQGLPEPVPYSGARSVPRIELLDGEHETVIGWLAEFLKRQL